MNTEYKTPEIDVDSPLLKKIMQAQPVTWLNPYKKSMADISSLPLKREDMEEADELLRRFAPFFMKAFPETASANGIIESQLKEIDAMKNILNRKEPFIDGALYLKCDNELPVAGSIKARGGFYEVVWYAEKLALEAGILKKTDDYGVFASEKFKEFFSQYNIGVGSTGNLGLSIGIISAQLGFKVDVYVSSDAKEWKKELLREKGATVLEIPGDFEKAIARGRKETMEDPMGYFVDDENSDRLYLGYSVAALRLEKQLKERGIQVNEAHPLFVYSPCGVGGSPGGVAFGLKQIYGDAVHCFYVEPTHSPSVLTGLVTGQMSKISVHDIGLDNKTEADGLAVGRPSSFATAISKQLISGIYTIADRELFSLLAQLMDSENIFLEPSATPGLEGPQRIGVTDYAAIHGIEMKKTTHIAWATGGKLVPQEARELFYEKGKDYLSEEKE